MGLPDGTGYSERSTGHTPTANSIGIVVLSSSVKIVFVGALWLVLQCGRIAPILRICFLLGLNPEEVDSLSSIFSFGVQYSLLNTRLSHSQGGWLGRREDQTVHEDRGPWLSHSASVIVRV